MINIIPRIISKAAIIFFIILSFSFKKKYPTITFKITLKAHSGATILTSPNWYALNCDTIDKDQVIDVIHSAFLFPFLYSSFISLNLILSKININIVGAPNVIATYNGKLKYNSICEFIK